MIIAVDGASGAGKSTICKLIAQEFDLSFLDSGAIYRAVALVSSENGVAMNDQEGLKKICQSMKLHFEFKNGENRVLLGERDISDDIRKPVISMLASKVSAIPVVRSSLLEMQRRFAKETKKKGVIIDGRDIGTVVFPNADIKIFLTASNEVRAHRRHNELKKMGIKADYQKVLEETIQRDKRDSERAISPLKKAPDAIEVDTDDLNIDEVKEKIRSIIGLK